MRGRRSRAATERDSDGDHVVEGRPRRCANAGLDPNRATELTLLEDHGLEASYLSAHLRPAPAAAGTPEPTVAVRSAEERLRELRSLLDSGLISQEEHDARRTVVLDSL